MGGCADYENSFFGYQLNSKEIYDSDTLDLNKIKKSWESFIQKKMSSSECIDISELDIYAYYDSYSVRYPYNPCSDLYLLFGYQLDNIKPVAHESAKGTIYNFAYNFPPNFPDLLIEFLIDEATRGIKGKISNEEREKLKSEILKSMYLGFFGSMSC